MAYLMSEGGGPVGNGFGILVGLPLFFPKQADDGLIVPPCGTNAVVDAIQNSVAIEDFMLMVGCCLCLTILLPFDRLMSSALFWRGEPSSESPIHHHKSIA